MMRTSLKCVVQGGCSEEAIFKVRWEEAIVGGGGNDGKEDQDEWSGLYRRSHDRPLWIRMDSVIPKCY